MEVGDSEFTELFKNRTYSGEGEGGWKEGRGEEAKEDSVVRVRETEVIENELCENLGGG